MEDRKGTGTTSKDLRDSNSIENPAAFHLPSVSTRDGTSTKRTSEGLLGSIDSPFSFTAVGGKRLHVRLGLLSSEHEELQVENEHSSSSNQDIRGRRLLFVQSKGDGYCSSSKSDDVGKTQEGAHSVCNIEVACSISVMGNQKWKIRSGNYELVIQNSNSKILSRSFKIRSSKSRNQVLLLIRGNKEVKYRTSLCLLMQFWVFDVFTPRWLCCLGGVDVLFVLMPDIINSSVKLVKLKTDFSKLDSLGERIISLAFDSLGERIIFLLTSNFVRAGCSKALEIED
ncbi:hypothetical protein LXL04_006529 [Taraxacum kok-saghyz]